jgi:hypothetical protein
MSDDARIVLECRARRKLEREALPDFLPGQR